VRPRSVDEFLKKAHVPFTVLRHKAAYSAQYQAAFAHVPGRSWAKTVVCWADEEPVLVVVPAHLRVDLEALKTLADAETLRLAGVQELGDLFPGCELGAISPFAPLRSLRVFVDQSFTGDPEMVFNAGTGTDAICMHYYDFAELTRPVVGSLATGTVLLKRGRE
jgi:Ala-tRNA(Pro) deacylase